VGDDEVRTCSGGSIDKRDMERSGAFLPLSFCVPLCHRIWGVWILIVVCDRGLVLC